MRNKKRFIAITLSFCLCFAVATGCKSKANNGISNGESVVSIESVESIESDESSEAVESIESGESSETVESVGSNDNAWSDENADGNAWT